MAVFVRRLFGIGKLPDELHAQVESEGLTYHADYLAVTRRFSGTIPGVRLPHSVASYTGSLVFTSERVLATLSMLPRLAGPILSRIDGQTSLGALHAAIEPTTKVTWEQFLTQFRQLFDALGGLGKIHLRRG